MRFVIGLSAVLPVALLSGAALAQAASTVDPANKVRIPAMCVAGAEFAANSKFKNDALAKAGPKWNEILVAVAPAAEERDAAKATTTQVLEKASKTFPGSEKDLIGSFARNCGGDAQIEEFLAEYGLKPQPAPVQGGQ